MQIPMNNMVMDKNPSFGADRNQENNARKVADMLWEVSGGDFSKVPSSYLESLGFEYSDGTTSLLDQLNKVDFSEDTTYEEFSEVVDRMVRVNPDQWPFAETIVSIQPDKLLYSIEPELPDLDFDFAESGDMSDKVELFLKKVISSVYLDGVSAVTDAKGNPPNISNNYLLSDDGKKFSGIFYDKSEGRDKEFPFEIREKSNGMFEIAY